MKIAVIGAGAIGCITGGLLWHEGVDVVLLGRKAQVEAINANGLFVGGITGGKTCMVPAAETLTFRPDILLLAVKSQDVEEACVSVRELVSDSAVLTMQNGVRSDELVSEILGRERIVSSVVMFGATYVEPGKVDFNFHGGLVMGKAFPEVDDETFIKVKDLMSAAFDVIVSDDIHGAHWTKLILNLNNAISGILGREIRDVFSDPELCRLGLDVMREALRVMDESGIRLASLPDLSVDKLRGLLNAPDEVGAEVYGNIMKNLSMTPLPGSVLQSIARGRETEVDFLNGEIALLASSNGFAAPLNEGITRLVKGVTAESGYMSRDELLGALSR
jgi:2-dehydropantoate 2-reductase